MSVMKVQNFSLDNYNFFQAYFILSASLHWFFLFAKSYLLFIVIMIGCYIVCYYVDGRFCRKRSGFTWSSSNVFT